MKRDEGPFLGTHQPDDNDIDTKNTEYWSVYKTVNQ